MNFDTFSPNNFTWEAEDYDFDPNLSPVRAATACVILIMQRSRTVPAANSYVEQEGDSGQAPATAIDYSWEFFNVLPIPTAYRTNDTIPIEVTGDAPRQKYLNAQLRRLIRISWTTTSII